jgi:hypothetical protein
MSQIEFKNVSKIYPNGHVGLKDINLSCRRLTDRNNVDFPAPDKPTITAKSPFSMFKLISFNPT